MSDIEASVKKVVAAQLDVEESTITAESRFIDGFGADSLDSVELVMSIEDETGVEIPDDVAESIITVGDAIEHLKKASS